MPFTILLAAATAATIAARDLTPQTDLEVRAGEIAWVENGKAVLPIVPFAALRDFPGARLPDLGAVNLHWTGNSTRMQFGGCVKDRPHACCFSRLYTKFHWFNNHAPAFGRFMFKEW